MNIDFFIYGSKHLKKFSLIACVGFDKCIEKYDILFWLNKSNIQNVFLQKRKLIFFACFTSAGINIKILSTKKYKKKTYVPSAHTTENARRQAPPKKTSINLKINIILFVCKENLLSCKIKTRYIYIFIFYRFI